MRSGFSILPGDPLVVFASPLPQNHNVAKMDYGSLDLFFSLLAGQPFVPMERAPLAQRLKVGSYCFGDEI